MRIGLEVVGSYKCKLLIRTALKSRITDAVVLISIVELVGADPVEVAHQVLANVLLGLLPGQVAHGRYSL